MLEAIDNTKEQAVFRIGIIGSDNSHATAFSRLANIPDEEGRFAFPDVRVTHILGDSPESAKAVAKACRIPNIVTGLSDLYEAVDAVMIVYRHGALHYDAALPFLERGIPVWIDKPLTINAEQCRHLIRTAQEHHTILAGGSTCKYCPDVLALQKRCREFLSHHTLISGGFNFPGEIDSPYGGIYFYGGHAAEILTTIFGSDIRSIKADVHCNNIIALVKYDTFTVTINFSEVSQFFGTLYSPEEVVQQPIDISTIYYYGFSKFVDALRQNAPVEPPESLLQPVLFLNALECAIKEGEAALP